MTTSKNKLFMIKTVLATPVIPHPMFILAPSHNAAMIIAGDVWKNMGCGDIPDIESCTLLSNWIYGDIE